MNRTLRDISALSVIGGFGLLAGIVTQTVLAHRFGVGSQLDIFFGAQTVPAFVFGQLAFCLGTSFLPVFSRVMEQEGEQSAWRYASNFLNSVALVGLVLGGVLVLCSRTLVGLFVPWLEPHELPLAVTVFQIAVLGSFYHCLFQLVGYLHNYRGQFVLVSAAGLLLNVCMMAGALCFPASGISAVALGLLIGHVLKLAIVARGISQRYRLSFSWRCAGSRRTYGAAAPMLGSVAVGKAEPVVERLVASGLEAGSIASLGLAGKIVSSLAAVTTQGVSTVIFPRLARLEAAADRDRVGTTLSRYVAQTFMLVMPLAVFVALFRVEVCRFLFERGAFTPAMTQHVATVVLCYSGVFALGGIGSILSRGFHISGRTHIPAAISIAGTAVYLALAIGLARSMGVAGIALAFSLEFVFGFTAQVSLLRRIYPTFSPLLVVGKACEYGGWAGLSGLLVRWALLSIFPAPSGTLALGATMALAAGLLGAVYFAGLLLVREPGCLALARRGRLSLQARRGGAVTLASAPVE